MGSGGCVSVCLFACKALNHLKDIQDSDSEHRLSGSHKAI
jgi:hypothetical protein